MGGCAHGNLVLKSTYPDNWVSELLIKAESIDLEVGEVSEEACSCSGSAVRNFRCPTVVGIDQKHFQRHLYKGEPVIVPDVLSKRTEFSWEPLVMWRGCRKSRRTNDARILEFSVTNCVNWCKETINMHQFFNGYSEGLLDSEGRPKILKLEDWPPTESFQERLPRHFVEFIRCLPFKLYTHQAGYLNMPAKTPKKSLKPDLGPKICFAYGVNEDLGFCSATKLQYALSDMVNVLMHTAATSLNPEELSTIVELGRKHIAQDPVVFSVSNWKAYQDATRNQQFEREIKNKGKEKFDPSTSGNNDQSFDEQKCGAIWDIFRRQDVPKLEHYLRRHYGEFRRIVPLQQLVHPIHEKAFYLTMEHKRKLKDEYGIEPWTFVQRLGDAVLVPAGCPYQARNLKSCTSMSIDFVSAESIGQCIRLSTEYRRLPKNHSCKEDKLQVKGLVLSAVCQAVQYLDKIDAITLRSPFAPPIEHGNVRHNPAQQGERPSTLQMRRELEKMKSALVMKGHLFQPHMKEYLLKEITLLTNKINSSAGSSSS
ncbi:PREDICTED: lysine-specific demethylase JMJ25-like [Erythranthe guttata]|uniref:lysine-specific demethylase JMJ25-like n=1 Tax=Erythranthe guttata TaxID=4155 RepID=UPI00064DBF50|nr:PREDICTED: lysine-specific demethylase JMJ25-like [Erythranthe guttata]|eukprot:XP_012857070.1 PREDICTED: lysine-specific demethylase JMJ25-like [Erythranthe guttata]